jgi:DNA-binding NtrC family response regulator
MATLIIVENESKVLNAAQQDLAAHDLTVVAVSTVDAFLKVLEEAKPDAIISDYYLDDSETGKHIWHATRVRHTPLPFIGTSSEVEQTWQKIVDSKLDKHLFGLPKRPNGEWDTEAIVAKLEEIYVIQPDIPF